MKHPTPVEYLFMFDSNGPWRNIFDFERDLATFFSERGIVAETSVMFEGYNGRKVVWLSKKEEILPAVAPSTEKSSTQFPTSSKNLIDRMVKK